MRGRTGSEKGGTAAQDAHASRACVCMRVASAPAPATASPCGRSAPAPSARPAGPSCCPEPDSAHTAEARCEQACFASHAISRASRRRGRTHQQRDARQRVLLPVLLLQQVVQLAARNLQVVLVRRVDHEPARVNPRPRQRVRNWLETCAGVGSSARARHSAARAATYTMAFTPLQYRSHMLRNRVCPPRSHSCVRARKYARASACRARPRNAAAPGGAP
jgi:hypothetical protein